MNRVINEAQLTPLPASFEVTSVSGGKQGFGTNYRVAFKADPEDLYKWMGANRAQELGPGKFRLSGPSGDSEGPIGKSQISVTPGGDAVLTYSASL